MLSIKTLRLEVDILTLIVVLVSNISLNVSNWSPPLVDKRPHLFCTHVDLRKILGVIVFRMRVRPRLSLRLEWKIVFPRVRSTSVYHVFFKIQVL